jgi:hypothetical protein
VHSNFIIDEINAVKEQNQSAMNNYNTNQVTSNGYIHESIALPKGDAIDVTTIDSDRLANYRSTDKFASAVEELKT